MRVISMIVLCGDVGSCGGGGSGSESSPPAEQSIFSGDLLNPTIWRYGHTVRMVENGEYVSEIARRDVGGATAAWFCSDEDPFGPASFQADVKITEARTKEAGVRAILQGRFYKDSAESTDRDRTGEINASIEIGRPQDSTALEVVYYLYKCQDSGCKSTLPLNGGRLGSAMFNQSHRLSVEFDGDKTFRFSFDNEPPRVYDQAPDAVAPPAHDPDKCPSSPSRLYVYGTDIFQLDQEKNPAEEAFIAARFDNVTVNNGMLEEDFELGSASTEEWSKRFHSVTRVADGKLELEFASPRDKPDQNLQLVSIKPAEQKLTADVTLTEATGGSGELWGRAQLQNRWYRSTRNGVMADVGSIARMDFDRKVRFWLSHGNENLWYYQYGPVSLSEPHTLSMAFDGTFITFSFDNETKMINTVEQAPYEGPPKQPFTGLVVRADTPGGEITGDGRVAARFDNVYVDDQLVDDFSPLEQPLPRGPASIILKDEGGSGITPTPPHPDNGR
jgi:hypothetical protein